MARNLPPPDAEIPPPTVLVVGVTPPEVNQVREILGSAARVLPQPVPCGQALDRVVLDRPRLVVVSLDQDFQQAVDLGALLQEEVPGLYLVAWSRTPDPDRIRAAMRAGFREYVVLPDDAEMLRRAAGEAARSGPAADSHDGRVVAVWGSKGGAGVTLLAVNLAAELARHGSVLLADLDFGMGDVGVFLDLTAPNSVADLVRNESRLDERMLESCVVEHGSGIRAIVQPQDVQEEEVASADAVLRILNLAARNYPIVVADCGTHADEQALAAVTAAWRVVLVTTPEVPAVRNAWRRVRLLDRLGVDRERVLLVVNRWSRSAPMERKDIEANLGIPVALLLSDDPRTAAPAVNDGRLLRDVARRAPLVQELGELVQLLSDAATEDPVALPVERPH